MLTLRSIGPDDYAVRDDGQPIGRIRLASDQTPAIWSWTITVIIPDRAEGEGAVQCGMGCIQGDARAEKLEKAFEAMNWANRPGRYGR